MGVSIHYSSTVFYPLIDSARIKPKYNVMFLLQLSVADDSQTAFVEGTRLVWILGLSLCLLAKKKYHHVVPVKMLR